MAHKFMLAAKTPDSLSGIDWPVLASFKIDGIRAAVVDGVLVSRNNKPIPNAALQTRYGKAMYEGLDGELIDGVAYGKDVYRTTASTVMSRDKPIHDVRLHVFDDFTRPEDPYKLRLRKAAQRVVAIGKKVANALMYVPHALLQNEYQLNALEADALAKGFEGLMLRSTDGEYKAGRSTLNEGWLIKIKRFKDGEAVIDGVEELQHNDNAKGEDGKRTSHKAGKRAGGVLGALTVRDVATGAAFGIGSGFTASERARLWMLKESLPGRVVTYRYFPTGSKAAPRFPTFRGFREDL
jgi:DNA ligase-1